MKITAFVAAAALATAASTSFAGDISDAGTMDDDIVIIPATQPAGSSGSLGGAAPAIAALLIIGAIAAGSGS